MKFKECNRCGSSSYENLKTHGYCIDCNYSSEADDPYDDNNRPIPNWAIIAIREGLMDRNEFIHPRIVA